MSDITARLDAWVTDHPLARGGYVDGSRPRDEVLAARPSGPAGAQPIQQVREEILAFADVLLGNDGRRSALEIGMGQYGGTHKLWSWLFDSVTTVEIDPRLVSRYREIEDPHPDQSRFVLGPSWDRSVILQACRHAGPVDLLFIDGDHLYDAVEADWRIYSHLVKPGGIVAFHDTVMDHPGEREVTAFVRALADGRIIGNPVDIRHIHRSVYVGISYYIA